LDSPSREMSVPAVLTVTALADSNPLAAAAVWHRPFVIESVKDAQAKRQARAAVTLLRLGQPEPVWPLFRHTPDPRLRSFLSHFLAPLEADPRLVIARLQEESDVSARRELLLSLGEFAADRLGPARRQALAPALLRGYRDDPDPGIHSATDWLLSRWG